MPRKTARKRTRHARKGRAPARGKSIGGISTTSELLGLVELGQGTGSNLRNVYSGLSNPSELAGVGPNLGNAAKIMISNIPNAAPPVLFGLLWHWAAPKIGATKVLRFKVGRYRIAPFG